MCHPDFGELSRTEALPKDLAIEAQILRFTQNDSFADALDTFIRKLEFIDYFSDSVTNEMYLANAYDTFESAEPNKVYYWRVNAMNVNESE